MTYTANDVLAVLDGTVVDFGPDHEVDDCIYVDRYTGEPVCIVAQVLDRLALPLPDVDDTWESVNDREEYDFTSEANVILDMAQTAQDGRTSLTSGDKSWGMAVALVHRLHEEGNL